MSEKNPLIIICGGGFAREVIWLARECSEKWLVKGILDDTVSLQGKDICGIPVIGTIDDWVKYTDASFVVAMGSPRDRKKIVSRLKSKGAIDFATLVHPSVQMSEYVELGEGCIVTAGCILTTQVKLGCHTIVNLSSTIGHDVLIGDFCTLAPKVAVSGNVSLGEGVEIGTGAIIIPGISIGTDSTVGAGAVVTKNVEENVLAIGMPARQRKKLA